MTDYRIFEIMKLTELIKDHDTYVQRYNRSKSFTHGSDGSDEGELPSPAKRETGEKRC